MKVMIFDITKCIGCYNCQLACQDEHTDNDWTPIAKPQSDGQSWIKVDYIERGTAPKVKVNYVGHVCVHCDKAPCMKAARNEAIYKRADGFVIIDPEKAKGQKQIVAACPYQAIWWNEELKLPQKCTGCSHLLDRGWKAPRCVTACPADALVFGEEEELKPLIARCELLYPQLGATKPRVHYLGIPKKFIAGEVWSPKEDLCIDGAEIVVENMSTREKIVTKTDNYGDFWVDGLQVGAYSVKVEKDGYYPLEVKNISTENDVNMGEIRLPRKA